MLRLSLVLAFLAALGALLVGQFVVKPKVDELTTNLAAQEKAAQDAQAAKAAADKKAAEAKAAADKANKDVAEMKTAVERLGEEATTQKQRADKLAGELDVTTKSKNEAQAKLSQWEALGVLPAQIVVLKDDLRKSIEERGVLTDENKVLDRKLKFTQARLLKYEEPSKDVELPAGLKGTVTSVSPASDFVFIDVGANQGMLERGKMMVRRGNKLVTKIQVVSVAPNHSIANILKDWNQGDVQIQVGDAVLY